MEIVSTSSALNMFPTRFKIKRVVGCKCTDFSDVSLLDPQILSRISGRDGEENMAMVAPRKRQYSDEELPPKKRQKYYIRVHSTTKANSFWTLKASLDKSVSESIQETKTKVTKPVDPRSIITEAKVTNKPEKSIKGLKDETETKKPDLRNLIAKAQHKIQEKKHIDQKVDIANQRIAARLALDQVVATVEFNEDLKHHLEKWNIMAAERLRAINRGKEVSEAQQV